MHIMLRPRSEILTVKFKDRFYEITLEGGEAYVPEDLGNHMLAKGLVMQGPNPNPKPRWEKNGDGWGELISMYLPWCKEVPQPEKANDTK